MALPTLDAVFASAADQPRKMMLAKWLVEELGETQAPSSVLVSGLDVTNANGLYVQNGELEGKAAYFLNGTNTSNSQAFIAWNGTTWGIDESELGTIFTSIEDVTYPWLVTNWGFSGSEAVTESPSPSPISNYVTLPERYLWAKIAVAAGAPRSEADYISLPKQYAWSDIYNAVSGDIAFSATTVSGAGSNEVNGTYTYRGTFNGKPYYNLVGEPDNADTAPVSWIGDRWTIVNSLQEERYESLEDTGFPWLVETWIVAGSGESPVPTLTQQTPNHTDWSEKQALGHIAAAYRGDTANPANLATYIDWPWRYQVASIITAL